MITAFGEGRGFRVVWLLEEMGLAYKLRPVDLLVGVENDPEYLAINPAGFIPAIQDGDVTMVESIAIMEYLVARYGPTPLAPAALDPAFPAYLQFLHLGEAGLAASMYFVAVSRSLAPEPERDNWGARKAMEVFQSRLKLVTRQLARSPVRGAGTHCRRHCAQARKRRRSLDIESQSTANGRMAAGSWLATPLRCHLLKNRGREQGVITSKCLCRASRRRGTAIT